MSFINCEGITCFVALGLCVCVLLDDGSLIESKMELISQLFCISKVWNSRTSLPAGQEWSSSCSF